jgi:hypothetical protein
MSALQKWFVVAPQEGISIEQYIDLSGQGHGQEFLRYAWVDISDLVPLTQDFKRGVYAHLVRNVKPLLQQMRAQQGRTEVAEAALVAAMQTLPAQRVVELVMSAYGQSAVLEQAGGIRLPAAPAADGVALPEAHDLNTS